MKIRPNRVKRKLAKGELAYIGGGLTHPDDIDAFGPVGFDGVWLEGEHGGADASVMGDLTRACDIWGMTSVARVNANDQGLIYRTLDCGAQAIVVPKVNTKEEAENVVEGGRFQPLGKRGMYTSRQGHGVDDFFAKANAEVLLIVLIEDILAVENLDEILTVGGIDVFFVAPADLAASMGYIRDLKNPKVMKTIDDAHARIHAAGRTSGFMTVNDGVAQYAAKGVRCFLAPVRPWVAAGAAEYMKLAEKGKAKGRSKGKEKGKG